MSPQVYGGEGGSGERQGAGGQFGGHGEGGEAGVELGARALGGGRVVGRVGEGEREVVVAGPGLLKVGVEKEGVDGEAKT